MRTTRFGARWSARSGSFTFVFVGVTLLIVSTVATASVLLALFAVGVARSKGFRRNAGLALFALSGLLWVGTAASLAVPVHPERMSLAVASEICGPDRGWEASAEPNRNWMAETEFVPMGAGWVARALPPARRRIVALGADDEHVFLPACVVSASPSVITVRNGSLEVVAEFEAPGLAPRSEWRSDPARGLLLLTEHGRRTDVWRVDPIRCDVERLNLGRLEAARFEGTREGRAVCVTGSNAAALIETEPLRALPRPAQEVFRNRLLESIALLVAFVSTLIGLGFGWGPSRDWYRANQRARRLVERLGDDDRPRSYREASGLTVGDLDQLLALRNQQRRFGWVAADRFATTGLWCLVFVIVPLLIAIAAQRGP